MIIKRRGWIGRSEDMESIVVRVDDELAPPGLSEGNLVVHVSGERGEKAEWNHDWPPRFVDVIIEIKETKLCAFCDEPYEGEMITVTNAPGFVHSSCVKARARAKKFYQEMDRIPDVLKEKKKIEPIKEYFPDMQPGAEMSPYSSIAFHSVILDITKKINELVERVNNG
jgi:hypothetical protein